MYLPKMTSAYRNFFVIGGSFGRSEAMFTYRYIPQYEIGMASALTHRVADTTID